MDTVTQRHARYQHNQARRDLPAQLRQIRQLERRLAFAVAVLGPDTVGQRMQVSMEKLVRAWAAMAPALQQIVGGR